MERIRIRTPEDFRVWLANEIDLLTKYGQEEPAENVAEEAADTVREAGEISLRFGLPDHYRECQVKSPMLGVKTAKELLGRCLQACSQLPAGLQYETAADSGDDETKSEDDEPRELKLIYEKAYRQYLLIEEVNGKVTDEQAYELLKQGAKDGTEDVLHSLETWKRYLREARRYYQTQKNSPRAGRTGRSIVKAADHYDKHKEDDDWG